MSLVACMCVSSGSAAGSESRASLADASTGLCVSILASFGYRGCMTTGQSGTSGTPLVLLDDCHNGEGGGTECVEFRARS